jgi:hypothetical protein
VIDDVEMQRLWMSLQKTAWRTMAIVPTTPTEPTLEIANTVAELCWTCRGSRTVAIDLRATNLRVLEHHRRHVDEHLKRNECIVLALPTLDKSPITVALARMCDMALLVVTLGETPLRASKQAIEDVGVDKFAGAILVRPKTTIVRLLQHDSRTTVRIPTAGANT